MWVRFNYDVFLQTNGMVTATLPEHLQMQGCAKGCHAKTDETATSNQIGGSTPPISSKFMNRVPPVPPASNSAKQGIRDVKGG